MKEIGSDPHAKTRNSNTAHRKQVKFDHITEFK